MYLGPREQSIWYGVDGNCMNTKKFESCVQWLEDTVDGNGWWYNQRTGQIMMNAEVYTLYYMIRVAP